MPSNKYRQEASLYKQSIHKGSSSSKYNSSSKKKHGNSSQMRKTQPIKNINTKPKYIGGSYKKTNISSTHKKYSKTARGIKKSTNSSSRLQEQGSTVGSNSSKLSPGYTPRQGLDPSSMNTKSYNSLMTMLMKDHEMYRTTGNIQSSGHLKSSSGTPNSTSKM